MDTTASSLLPYAESRVPIDLGRMVVSFDNGASHGRDLRGTLLKQRAQSPTDDIFKRDSKDRALCRFNSDAPRSKSPPLFHQAERTELKTPAEAFETELVCQRRAGSPEREHKGWTMRAATTPKTGPKKMYFDPLRSNLWLLPESRSPPAFAQGSHDVRLPAHTVHAQPHCASVHSSHCGFCVTVCALQVRSKDSSLVPRMGSVISTYDYKGWHRRVPNEVRADLW
jgi:hypothetical protein